MSDVEGLTETLRKAYEAVEAAAIPEHLHEAAFRAAVRLLAPAASSTAASGTATHGRPAIVDVTSEGGNGQMPPLVSESEVCSRVERQTGVALAKIEQLVHLDDGVPKITVPSMRLGRNNAEKTRVIAQILTIVRGFGLDENDTPIDAVRSEALRLKCYDSANFMTQLSKLDGFVVVGSGQGRRIRAKSNGIQMFPELVDKVLGEA